MGEVNYEAWAVALCTLLDHIEMSADDPDKVRSLCKERFEIAENYGLTVEMGFPVSGEIQ